MSYYTLAVEFDNGSQAFKYYDNSNRTFIEGREGNSYKIVFTNLTGDRVKAVISVDGINVISGKNAELDGEGYVVDAYGVIKIPGWLVDSKDAARFRFGKKASSYAATREESNATNCGVIGCTVYKEIPKVVNYPFNPLMYHTGGAIPYDHRYYLIPTMPLYQNINSVVNLNNLTIGASAATASMSTLGTEFGEATEFKTQKVDYIFEKNYNSKIVIYYDSRKNLIARGIIPTSELVELPDPFPASNNYCTPPKNWTK